MNRIMMQSLFILMVAACVSVTFSFVTPSILCRSTIRTSLTMKMPEKIANKDEKGMMDRFEAMAATKRKAAAALKGNNKELAAELEEMADEMKETADAFGTNKHHMISKVLIDLLFFIGMDVSCCV